MFNAVFCVIPGFDASEMDVLSCDVWKLVLFVCWIRLSLKKIMPEPMQHGTPIRSCKISGIATWIFEIVGLLPHHQTRSIKLYAMSQPSFFFLSPFALTNHRAPHLVGTDLYDFQKSAKIWCGDVRKGSLKNAPT